MRRLSLRLLMVLVGLLLLAIYLAAAAVGYQLLVFLWDRRPGLLRLAAYFLAVTLLVGYLSFRLGTAGLLAELETVEIAPGDAPWLHRRLRWLCAEFDVAVPTVYAARMESLNALALGTGRGGALVFDYGLFRLLSPEELQAVIAHELTHLRFRDGLIQTVGFTAVRTAGGLLYLALLPAGLLVGGVLRAVSWLRGEPPNPFGVHLRVVRLRVAQSIVLLLFGLTLALRALSRRREYAADDRAVEVTGNPIALARALVKIQRAASPGFDPLSPLYIHGDEEGPLTRLLASHPPMEERIARLIRKADESGRTAENGPIRRTDAGIRR